MGVSIRSSVSPAPARSATGRKSAQLLLTRFVPALLGTVLYLVNNLDVIYSYTEPRPGYVALGVQRVNDLAVYLSWLRGFEQAWFVPNFNAAWSTSRSFMVIPLIPVAKIARLLRLAPASALQLFSFAAYIFTAYALAFALKTFCRTRRQAIWSIVTAFACVPLTSLPIVFEILHNHSHLRDIDRSQFVLITDGFVRGIITYPLLTFGTGFQLLSMALLARYSNSLERRWFSWLALVCLLSAVTHPFEVFVTLGAVSIVLLRQCGLSSTNLTRIGIVFVAAGIGLSPYALQSSLIPWVHEISRADRAPAITPAHLLAMIGLPAMVVIVLLLLGFPEDRRPETSVLTAWFFVTFLAFFTPFLPFASHMLDGLFFAVGLLLVLQVSDAFAHWSVLNNPFFRVLALATLLFSLIPQMLFRFQLWDAPTDMDRNSMHQPVAATLPEGEFAAVQWLRLNANENDLVLAPGTAAPWLATVPIHSFASHWLMSLESVHPNYAPLRDSFFAGSLSPIQAHQLLETLGVRFVFVPDEGPAIRYLGNAIKRSDLDACSIYEIPGAHIRPYDDPEVLALGEPPRQKR
jgi:hypothetical protein